MGHNGNKLISYLKSKDFRTQIKYMAAIFFAIIFTASILLHFYTRHNKFILMPDFRNLTLSAAYDLAKDNHIRIEVSDSVFSIDHIPGSILEQDIKPGTKVKKNRRVLIIINANMPEKVTLPDIDGVTLRQASATLESVGLYIGKISYVSDIASNVVLRVKKNGKIIKDNEKLQKGSYVDLELGIDRPLSLVAVPNLSGLSLREARKQIALSMFNTGKIYYDTSVKTKQDTLNAIVYKQKPPFNPDSKALMASNIDLWLTVNK